MASGLRWRLEEFILCLDLYIREGAIGNNHAEVVSLAKLIGRTPGSVALRLANFQFVDPDRTGPGKSGGERDCRPIWLTLAHRQEVLTELVSISKALVDSRKRE